MAALFLLLIFLSFVFLYPMWMDHVTFSFFSMLFLSSFNFYSLSHVNSVTFTLSFYLSSILLFLYISLFHLLIEHSNMITRITREEKEVWAQITNHQIRHHIIFFFSVSSLLCLFVTLLLHPLSLFSLCSL